MSRIRIRLFMGFLAGLTSLVQAACGLPLPAPAADCLPGNHDLQLASGGQVRSYRLYVPPDYETSTPASLVIGLHGQGGDAAGFEAYSGFSRLANETGFLAVYPQGLGELCC